MNPVISNNFALTALKQGEDAFVCDLTNQMDAVPVDANGKVTSKTDVSTTARIIKGAGIIPSGITPTPAASMVIAGVTPTVNISDGEVTYTWSFAKGTTVSDARYVKKITLTYNGHSYSADFTLVTDKSGATYNLLPSLSEIPFVRNDNNVLTPSSMYVYCGYVKNQDGTVTTINGKGDNQHTNIDSRYYIYYRIKNADGTYGSYTQMTKSGIQVKNSDTYAAIEFVMSSATTVGGIADANIIDIEDVPVIRQNERGYGIVCSVQRNNFTEAQWNTDPGYGVIGHSDTFTDTSSIRNGARKGDLFTVVGTATDTRNGHTATYRCTNASGNLSGVCIAHQIAKAGETAFTADISNEADLFGTDVSGKVIEAQQRSTKGHLFYGTKRQTLSENPTVSLTYASSGSAVPSTVADATTLTGKDTEEANITITLKANQTITDAIYADITLKCDKGTKVCRFTLKPVKSGNNGVSPELWQLALDKDDLSFSRNDDNSLSPDSITLHAYAEKTVGATTTKHTSAVTGLSISWGYDEEGAQETSKAIGTAISVSNSTAASKRFVWVELYQSGVSEWIDRETVPINKDGKVGETGNGINSVTLYRMFTMTFAAPSANDSVWKSEGTYDVSGLSKTNRYLWQKKVTTYTKTTSVDNEISLIAQFDNGVQPNLLEDTAFNSDGELDAWTVRNQLSPSGTPDYTPGVKTGSNAKDGVNSYYDRTAYGSSTIQYKEVLQQDIWNYSGVRKIDYSDWYTFSFWAKGTSATSLNTYIYPYCVDPNQGLYINGIRITGEYSNSDFSVTGVTSDCCVSWKLSSSWKKFTVTFRTRSSFYNSGYSTQKVLFRLLPAGTSDNYCYICMPKLERNTMATAWLEHTNDRMADDIQHVYVGNWVSGTTYYYGGGTGVRHVVRAKESASGSMTYWRMKQRTTSAGYKSTIQPYNDTNHWEKANYLKFVATDLLLAEEIIVENLIPTQIKSKNDNFVVDADGNVTANTGTFNNITVQSGTIAGFKVSGTGLTNDPFTNDAYIIFRNDARKAFAGIGGNVLPAASGLRAVARFENEDQNNYWGLGANYAMILSAKNADRNYAYAGSGHGVLNGNIVGYQLNNFTPSSSLNTIDPNKGKYVLVNGTYGTCYLPTLSVCRNFLGVGDSTHFAFDLYIMCGHSSGFTLFGYRSSSLGANCPHMRNPNSDQDMTGGLGMGSGDTCHLVIIYNGTNFDAYIMGHLD